jgi:hypothetical protein
MNGDSTDPWESLFVTEAGVAAVLAGLLFVAVSINLVKVIQHPGLPGRAAEAVGLLVGVLWPARWASCQANPAPSLAPSCWPRGS